MRKLLLYLLWAGALFGTAGHAYAIAVEDLPTSEAPPTNEGYTFNWDHIYNYKGSSATAVDHYWILTAAHVADDGGTGNLTINGETYIQQEVVFHAQAADPDGNPTADMALVRYDKPFPGYYLLADTVPMSSDIIICGYGFSGDVVAERFVANFTQTGSTHTTKRWGTNKIDGEKMLATTVPIAANSKGFDISISRDRNGTGLTVYEAGCNIYDSGGGMFYADSGTWKLVGHMVVRYGGDPFSGNFAVATTYYKKWIKSVIADYDTDMDGLPDWWEDAYGETDAGADPDADQFTNYEEWLADTVPTNGNSFLEVTTYTNATSLIFSSSTNRKYQIEYSTSLFQGIWTEYGGLIDGANAQTVQEVSTTGSNRFYRVRALLH